MQWNYYIAHLWDEPTTIWEDVYLYPAEPPADWSSHALSLTIDAVSEESFGAHGMTPEEYAQERDGVPTTQNYKIDGATMTLYASDFDRQTMLKCARIWLERNGFVCTGFSCITGLEMGLHAGPHHHKHHFPPRGEV